MSRTKKRSFSRSVATREYRKVITIFPEGEKTENCYFSILKEMSENINIIVKKGDKKTEPNQVLSRAKKYIRESGLSKNEQIWLVIDVDNRPESSFKECLLWEKANHKYNVAISNPNFEYWLLMHFESGDGVRNTNECMSQLIKYIPQYSKSNISHKDITKERCLKAIENGAKRHKITDILKDSCSTVYKLVEEVMK
ncbi:TPA: RloB family protein [Legionella pneumophila]|uniref:RloB family protein n=1 Tax=Legionella pneumophila TaxID=446 RepID=UPI001C1B342A|nr:RloB domain-containing protein [Legionella pneumophila]